MNLETKSLLLRRLYPHDAVALTTAVYGNQEVMRFLPHQDIDPLRRSEQTIARYNAYWKTYGYGPWAVLLKSSGVLIGRGGLKPLSDTPDSEVEFIFAIAPAYWRQGFGTEIARASLCYGFDVLGKKRVVALTEHGNTPSQAALQKIGMVSHGLQIIESYADQPLCFFDLFAENWQTDCSTVYAAQQEE